MAGFPYVRMRRLRKIAPMREMLFKTRISPSELVYPIFVDENATAPVPIDTMPNCFRFPIDGLTEEVQSILDKGVKAVLLFGIPSKKDKEGSEAFAENGVIQKATRVLKKEFGDDLLVMTDVCLCEYTVHGHCGILKNDEVDNDATLEVLGKVAVSHAEAGADIVAPSSMMDGQVKHIRNALDEAGFKDVAIMSYSAKYASSFYSPFREAAESAPKFGDRRSYQMAFGSQKEALREIELDIMEGADLVMVKPALAYLDIIQLARTKITVPIAAYNVSGEYAMIKAAAKMGWIDEKAAVFEILTAIKRAGADIIITYYAKEVASWLNQS